VFPDDITIRKARPADAASLSVLATEVWLDTYAVDGITPPFAAHVLDAYSRARFEKMLDDPAVRLHVAARGDSLLGYVKVNLSPEPPSPTCGTGELETLYIRRHHQLLGIGRKLFRCAMDCLKAKGHEQAFVTVFEDNRPAIAFYDRLGMAVDGTFLFRFEGEEAPNLIYTGKTARLVI